jgi:hypothetical protein
VLSPQLDSLKLTVIPALFRQVRVCLYPISCCCSRSSDNSRRSASPFWRTSSSNSKRDASLAGERKVFGASYSHADILNFDNLYPSPIPTPDDLCLQLSQEHFQQQHTTSTHPALARQSSTHQDLDQSLSPSPTPLLLQLLWRKHKDTRYPTR